MGIRFRCHECDFELHVKSFLEGKRGKCPKCGVSFRIPSDGAMQSQPVSEAKSSGPQKVSKSVLAKKPTDTLVDMPKNSKSKSSSRIVEKPVSTITIGSSTENVKSRQEVPPTESRPNEGQFVAAAVYHVRPPSGGQYGPTDANSIATWVQENRLTADSWIWQEPWKDWRPLIDVFPDLFVEQSHLSNSGQSPPRSHDDQFAEGISIAGTLTGTATRSDGVEQMRPGGANNTTTAHQVVRDHREKRKRRRTMMIVAALLVLSALLIGTLIFVLVQGITPVGQPELKP